MESDINNKKNMGSIGRIIGIFTYPKETFEEIERKPTWLVPFLITVTLAILMNLLAMQIGIRDHIARMEARDLPQEQIESVKSRMEGPMKYLNIPIIPVATLAVWAILAGIFLFAGNTLIGGDVPFKKVFSVVAWSSLVGMLGGILKTGLILSKGTTIGVTTSLAILLPSPELDQKSPILYRILSKFDLFTIWQLILWIIGLAVIYRFTIKKSASLVFSLWAIWIIISVTLGTFMGGMFGG